MAGKEPEFSADVSLVCEMPNGIEEEVSFPLDFDIFILALALQLIMRGLPSGEEVPEIVSGR